MADPDLELASRANTEFGFRLLRRLTGDQHDGNVFFSPFSIASALAMMLNGAGGQTRNDMAEALGLGQAEPDRVNDGNGLLLKSLARPAPKSVGR